MANLKFGWKKSRAEIAEDCSLCDECHSKIKKKKKKNHNVSSYALCSLVTRQVGQLYLFNL